MKNRSSTKNQLKSSNGFSLVEISIVTGIMGIVMLAMITIQSNQVKANNYLEFQLKRTQLQGTIIGQFLKDPNNCGCLFRGAYAFPSAGTTNLTGVTPTQIGIFTSAAPACGTPTQFFINGTGIDGMKATSIALENITPTPAPNIYTGSLNLIVQSTKEVLGPKELPIKMPVAVTTTPAGANVNFVSCSTTAPDTSNTILADPGTATFPNGLVVKWGTFTVTNDGPGGFVNFVTPFPNAVFHVQVQSPAGNGNSQDNAASATGWNINGFNWTNAKDNFPVQGTYFATGH